MKNINSEEQKTSLRNTPSREHSTQTTGPQGVTCKKAKAGLPPTLLVFHVW